MSRLLVLDRDPQRRAGLVRLCRSLGHEVRAASPEDGPVPAPTDAVLLAGELREEPLRRLTRPGAPPLVLVAEAVDLERALAALRVGARDLLSTPVAPDALAACLDRLLEEAEAPAEHAHGLVGESAALAQTAAAIERVARAPRSTVLVLGESGTGKELVSRAVHAASAGPDAPFVAVNCAALTEGLLEAELFGYEAGTFTGADPRGREGLLAAARGGTLFLDEIAELAPVLQAKLLRVLQERTYRRVGGTRDLPFEARVVASTHRDLVAMVAEGSFREDLFYRLNVLSVRLPALRERAVDVPELAEHFLARIGRELVHAPSSFAPEALEDLAQRPWPGNVRELCNAVERLALTAEGERVELADLACLDGAGSRANPEPAAAVDGDALPLGDRTLRSVEEALIRRVLDETHGNRSRAARVLGVHRQTLYNKLRTYGIAG